MEFFASDFFSARSSKKTPFNWVRMQFPPCCWCIQQLEVLVTRFVTPAVGLEKPFRMPSGFENESLDGNTRRHSGDKEPPELAVSQQGSNKSWTTVVTRNLLVAACQSGAYFAASDATLCKIFRRSHESRSVTSRFKGSSNPMSVGTETFTWTFATIKALKKHNLTILIPLWIKDRNVQKRTYRHLVQCSQNPLPW